MKISQITGVIYRIRENMGIDSLKLIYFSLIYPYLLYGAAIWGGACKTYINSLFVSQKKVLRIMNHKGRYDHTNSLFHQHNMLKLSDVIELQTGLFVYNALNIFSVDCSFQYPDRNITTRRPTDLKIPSFRTSHSQQSVSYRGVKIWNKLPQDIRDANSRASFKNKVKQKLLHSYGI